MTLLQTLRARRDQATERLRELRSTSTLTDVQVAEIDRLVGELPDLEARINELQDQERRSTLLAQSRTHSGGPARVLREQATYAGRNDGPSFIRDITTMAIRGFERDAAERLDRHRQETMQERALSTTDGAGGELVPPAWMVDQFVELARAGRVTADRMQHHDLPSGTDSLNVPRMATGTAVAEQATQNSAVQATDATTDSVTAAVKTLAGGQVVAVQLIEQSPVNVDQLLLADLAADYAAKLNLFCLSNTGTNAKGILQLSGTTAVTYTDASPTVAEFYSKLAGAISSVTTARYLPPDAIVMSPRRWAWITAASDSSNRPLVLPAGEGTNGIGTGNAAAVGRVGSLLGLPVYVDPQIPLTNGAGTNEDQVIVGRFSDAHLYEGTLRSEAFRETKADQLSVYLRVYNYAAVMWGRRPSAFAIVSGTGLVAPTF